MTRLRANHELADARFYVIAEAGEKEGFQLEDLLYRLTTFPIKALRH